MGRRLSRLCRLESGLRTPAEAGGSQDWLPHPDYTMRLIYHPDYDLNLGGHVFPSKKYRLIHDRLSAEGYDFVAPEPASDEDLLLVHGRGWVTRLMQGTLHEGELQRLEIPWSQKMADAFRLAAGGTTLAARCALRDGSAFNIGGGFHHAFPTHGEGFCAIHDVAVAIRKLQQEKLIERVLVVDVDVHQGNGTAAIFASDESVFTLSIHQFNNYPQYKPPSDIDVHLEDGVGDEEYLHQLDQAVERALGRFEPQLLMYVAGADPYKEDQLGGLALTIEGLKERDQLVFSIARHRKIPICVTLAGGYARNVEDTVTIHANTARLLREA
jgi:acetoin utilization deacetylase AcuC-like enzyme